MVLTSSGTSDGVAWIWVGAGAVLVCVVLWEIFHTLWHPRGLGPLTRLLFRATWRAAKHVPALRSSELAGPLAMLFATLSWAGTAVLGFALAYRPFVPDGVEADPALRGDQPALLTAVYLSLVALATLGLGDVVPRDPVLQIVLPVQALVGFVLLSAVIAWVLQLYPALTRRRVLARRLTSARDHGTADLLETARPSIAFGVLEGFREALTTTELDLLQHGESSYVRDRDENRSLAVSLAQVRHLVAGGRRSSAPEVRHAADLLDDELDRLGDLLALEFVHTQAGADVLSAFALDHGHVPAGART